jgi:hypothetical protein
MVPTHAVVMRIRIVFTTTDGEEHEEQWSSVERFRSWAVAEGQELEFTAYEENDDGEWALVSRGRVRGAC